VGESQRIEGLVQVDHGVGGGQENGKKASQGWGKRRSEQKATSSSFPKRNRKKQTEKEKERAIWVDHRGDMGGQFATKPGV